MTVPFRLSGIRWFAAGRSGMRIAGDGWRFGFRIEPKPLDVVRTSCMLRTCQKPASNCEDDG
ncbi:hypothetical protein [Micromonospora sp. NBC_01813]|uniref:hypothetical protein n=1 Tax=Micromonospora sp. NBC_01813 TaxID=2975988 RepID=UPI002DDAC383|nr:hypothetical protein [Micromonospora sp. NBC_01813]WSA09184.1 hypothetical protein OG958_34420 [Micromonospora sp. NBC_01813]